MSSPEAEDLCDMVLDPRRQMLVKEEKNIGKETLKYNFFRTGIDSIFHFHFLPLSRRFFGSHCLQLSA